MKTRIFRVVCCIGMLIGVMASAPGMPCTNEIPAVMDDMPAVVSDTVDDMSTVNGPETSDHVVADDSPEAVNAFGMPLMDDTVLLATMTEYRAGDYERIEEQYEFDKDGRILRHLEHWVWGFRNDNSTEYEYNDEGILCKETGYKAENPETEEDWELDYWIEYTDSQDGINGDVSRTEREYNADGSLSRESVYGNEDRLLREVQYSRYVKDVLYYQYEYDSIDRASWQIFYDDQGNIESQYREEFDEAGNRILYAIYDGDGRINVIQDCECGPESYYEYEYPYWTCENIYDEHGNLVKVIVYGLGNEKLGYTENTYDDNGNMISTVDYDSTGREEWLREYTYDEEGYLIGSFSASDYDTGSDEYTYDRNGNCISLSGVIYMEDENGNLKADSPYQIWERSYDEKNRVIRYQNFNEYTKCWYEYTYDTFGISDETYPYDKIKKYME